eukprot:49163-Eustigmatos_ZCMA.PRE.1
MASSTSGGFTEQVLHRYVQALKPCFLELADVLLGNPATFFNDGLSAAVLDIERRGFTTQPRRHQLHGKA